MNRIPALDLLRGLIMILMAIDHAGFFIAKVHRAEFWGIPLPQYDDAFTFFTRYVTHLCAPGFFYLMGAGMVLFAASRRAAGWPEGKIIKHFALRGFILVLMQQFLENPAWILGVSTTTPAALDFDMGAGGGGQIYLHLGVLNALGLAMIAGAFLLRWHRFLLAGIALAAIVTTQLVTPGAESVEVLFHPLRRILFTPGQSGFLNDIYPLVPWLGVTILGMIFAQALLKDNEKAFRRLLLEGIGFLLLFVVLRFVGGFGNTHDYGGNGWMAFLNVIKYPPSIAFLLIMLGVNFLLLYLFHQLKKLHSHSGNPLMVFGKTALFFYISHLYLYMLIGLTIPDGLSITMMYPFWAAGLVVLYFLCRWYSNFKRNTSPDSIWRFF